MAQILVRGIDDHAMELFRRRAERQGWSKEQLARMVIEREAEAEAAWTRFESRARQIRERLKAARRRYGDAARDVRADRDR